MTPTVQRTPSALVAYGLLGITSDADPECGLSLIDSPGSSISSGLG